MVTMIPVEEQRLQKERVRVYALARELDVESKDLLDLCKQAGFDVKNQLSNLEPEQVTALKEMMKRGPKTAGAPPAAAKPVTPVLMPEVGKAMPNLTQRPRRDERPAAQAPAVSPQELEEAPSAPPAIAPAASAPPS